MIRFSRPLSRRLFGVAVLAMLCIANPSAVLAHSSQPLAPHDFWTAWTWEPVTVVSLIVAYWSYRRGVERLWLRAGRGHSIRGWQSMAFTGGLLALFVALISPLDALSGVLFSAHMVQHMLLMFVAAPLLALSAAPMAMLWSLPLQWRQRLAHGTLMPVLRRCWAFVTRPLNAWIIYTVALWSWHTPLFFQAALENDFIHAQEHLCFLITSYIFWWVLLKPHKRRSVRYGIDILYVFTTGLHSSALGALLLFSSQLWYPAYAANVFRWGLTPLGDQQLAGLLMWLPMGVVYLMASAVLLVLWLGGLESEMQQRERRSITINYSASQYVVSRSNPQPLGKPREIRPWLD